MKVGVQGGKSSNKNFFCTNFRSGNKTTQGMPPSINQRTALQCSELALFWW